jgi:hypothetical protein
MDYLNTFLKIVKAEGLDISKAFAPVLATQPLFTEPHNPLNGNPRRVSNDISSIPNASLLAEKQLSMPTFTYWTEFRPLIDDYISVLRKIWECRNFLSECVQQAGTELGIRV